MDSWAATDVTYDGPNGATIPGKEEPLAEMQAVGFVPTYFDINGNVVFGDGLTAQHMNFILNDLYAKYTALLARVEGS